MKFKRGLTNRRIRYATALFQKNPGVSLAEVSRYVKTRYGTGMANRLLETCRQTADAEQDAKTQVKHTLADARKRAALRQAEAAKARVVLRQAEAEKLRKAHVARYIEKSKNGKKPTKAAARPASKPIDATVWKADVVPGTKDRNDSPKAATLEISTKWLTPVKQSPRKNGFPAEFHDGLRLVKKSLLDSDVSSGWVRLALKDKKLVVEYDLQVQKDRMGEFEVKD
jgi:hypothetical protein